MKRAFITSFILAISLHLSAGNLEPSTSPGEGGTMKTLDQVEPRTPIGPETTAGDGTYEYIISESGSYYLTDNVDTTKAGIKISVDDVSIDLMGFTLKGSDDSSKDGIRLDGEVKNIEIRNGTVRDFNFGISQGNTNCQNTRVIGVTVKSNLERGISLIGTLNMVRNCTATENGTNADPASSYIRGIGVGANSMITECAAYNNATGATGYNTRITGISAGNGSIVKNCTANNNGFSANLTGTSSSVRGISVSSGCTITNNAVYDNGNSAECDNISGIFVTYGCTVIGNTSYDNGTSATSEVTGIYIYNGCLVDQNTAYSNVGTNIRYTSGATYGLNVGVVLP